MDLYLYCIVVLLRSGPPAPCLLVADSPTGVSAVGPVPVLYCGVASSSVWSLLACIKIAAAASFLVIYNHHADDTYVCGALHPCQTGKAKGSSPQHVTANTRRAPWSRLDEPPRARQAPASAPHMYCVVQRSRPVTHDRTHERDSKAYSSAADMHDTRIASDGGDDSCSASCTRSICPGCS